MRWILSAGKDIAVDGNQIQARMRYIQSVTNAKTSTWRIMQVKGKAFYICESYDEINGTFITAHIYDVFMLCSLSDICASGFIVANTCIWHKDADKETLKRMRLFNKNIELWFAKQDLFLDGTQTLRQSTELNNIGLFGFQTSLSERNLFKNRKKGLVKAIRESFVRVSPIILGD